jgi:precorrin-2/cobalt-factor-2 C20-methyltransferase
MSPPRLVGVGVGPGDPQLLTLAGLAEFRAASRIFVPVLAAGLQGRAETVVRAHLGDADGRIERLNFALNDDIHGSQRRRHDAWDEAASAVAEHLRAHGGSVAFATLGDPNVYSTFGYLAGTVRELLPEVEVRTVPGITAMQAAASAAGITLTEGAEPLTLLPMTRDTAPLRDALHAGGTVVAYKGGRRIGELYRRIEEAGAVERAVYAEHLGTPDERVLPFSGLKDEMADDSGANENGTDENGTGENGTDESRTEVDGRPYLSTVVVVPDRKGRGEQL